MSPTPRRPHFALLLALLALLLLPSTASARPFETGISGIGDYNPLSFERTRDAGAHWVRLVLDWEGVAPETLPSSWDPTNPADPHYNWGYVDTGVIEAVQHGLNPLLLVDGAPKWAQRCTSPIGQTTEVCDPHPAALAAFATAAARRYSGTFNGLPRVQYWEGLNEPNYTGFFFPQFNTEFKPLSPGLYRALINNFYDAVNAVDPSNIVVGGGLGPTEKKGVNIGPLRFTRELLCMKGHVKPKPIKGCEGGVRLDAIDVHSYTTGGPTHEGRPNDVQMGDLGKMQTLLRAADKAGHLQGQFKRTQLWITEFAWDSSPPDPNGLPMKILTQWTAEALHEAWANGVTHFFWYLLRDQPMTGEEGVVQSGLYLRADNLVNDQPKEVLVSFRFPFVAFARKPQGRKNPGGLEYWGRTPSSGPGTVELQAFRGGRWQRLARVKADNVGIFRGTLKSSYGRGRKGAVGALVANHTSVPFPMKRVGDFRHPPFG
ncbi:MAG TPA: hypothetical protein VNR67_01340 [Solirubrobacterales bacterium]|nr:hypothetical protein [Solirubrobacterales bacterium]